MNYPIYGLDPSRFSHVPYYAMITLKNFASSACLDLCNNFSTETGAKEWTPCWNIHVQLVVVHQTYLMINKVYNKGRPLSDTILIRYLYVCHLTKQVAWPSNCPKRGTAPQLLSFLIDILIHGILCRWRILQWDRNKCHKKKIIWWLYVTLQLQGFTCR